MRILTALIAILGVVGGDICLRGQIRPLPRESDVPYLKDGAYRGDPLALYQLAACYMEEIGVEYDPEKALSLALQAAEKGDVPAMVMVSFAYQGFGRIKRDKDQAVKWARKAYESGDPLGVVPIAQCHLRGFMKDSSHLEAIRLLRSGARSDNTYIISQLAAYHLLLDIAGADREEGIRLARVADSRGEQSAAGTLAFAYLMGRGVKRDLGLAESFALKDISRRGKIGHLVMALLCFQPERMPVDGAKASRHLRICIQYDLPIAHSLIARLHIDGNGVSQSMPEAIKALRYAAMRGDTSAMDLLGGLLFHGQNTQQDRPLAIGLWHAAASLGHQGVQEALNGWPTHLKNSMDFAFGSQIAVSINAQLKRGDYPMELAEDFHSSDLLNRDEDKPLVDSPKPKSASAGSGMIFTKTGYCFTNHHVIEGATSLRVFIPGTKSTFNAKLVASDSANDLAILQIVDWKPAPNVHPTPPPLASAGRAKIGDKAFTIGFPLSVFLGSTEHKYASGDISATSGFNDDRRVFQITTPIQPGNSGGPLALADGRIIGVIVSTVNFADVIRNTNSIPQNVNFAVKIDYLKLLAASSGIDIPEDLKPGQDPIEHVKAYTVQVIAEK